LEMWSELSLSDIKVSKSFVTKIGNSLKVALHEFPNSKPKLISAGINYDTCEEFCTILLPTGTLSFHSHIPKSFLEWRGWESKTFTPFPSSESSSYGDEEGIEWNPKEVFHHDDAKRLIMDERGEVKITRMELEGEGRMAEWVWSGVNGELGRVGLYDGRLRQGNGV